MSDLTDSARYLDRFGDTWEAYGSHLVHVARADGGHLIAPEGVHRRSAEIDIVIRDFGPMTPIGSEE